VPAVVNAGGHVNKFLGDGALAVFGAPNDLADHADAAVTAAILIQRLVAERFGGALRIRCRDQHRCGDRWHHRRRRQA
jgi:class 3 adenylate cyclase